MYIFLNEVKKYKYIYSILLWVGEKIYCGEEERLFYFPIETNTLFNNKYFHFFTNEKNN